MIKIGGYNYDTNVTPYKKRLSDQTITVNSVAPSLNFYRLLLREKSKFYAKVLIIVCKSFLDTLDLLFTSAISILPDHRKL